jgi:YbbR domain-containing protein
MVLFILYTNTTMPTFLLLFLFALRCLFFLSLGNTKENMDTTIITHQASKNEEMTKNSIDSNKKKKTEHCTQQFETVIIKKLLAQPNIFILWQTVSFWFKWTGPVFH